jgi:hypothetical protein
MRWREGMRTRNWRKALKKQGKEVRIAVRSRLGEEGRRAYFSDFSTSLLGPKMPIRRAASSEVRPFSSHLEVKEKAKEATDEQIKKRSGKPARSKTY